MPDTIPQSSHNSEDIAFSLNIPEAGAKPSDDIMIGASSAPQKEEEEIKIYSMPKEFLGVKGKKKKPAPKAEAGAQRAAMPPITIQREQAGALSDGKKRKKLIIGVVALIFFVGAGAAAGYFLFMKQGADILPSRPSPAPEAPPPPPPAQVETPAAEVQPPQEEQVKPPSNQDVSAVLSGDLIQKPVVSYNDRGMKTTEAVLSLEKEESVNYKVVTVNEYIVSEKPEYFMYVAGQPYEVQLRGETLKGKGVITITYSEDLLKTLDIIEEDLRIGYLPFSRLKETLYRPRREAPDSVSDDASDELFVPSAELEVQTDEDGEVNEEMIDDAVSEEPEMDAVSDERDGSAADVGEEEASSAVSVIVWDILKAQDLDDDIRSISSVLEEVHEGIYAIVPMNVNGLIELPQEPAAFQSPAVSDEIVLAADSDGDELSDREELLYGTSPLSPDSDGDGYADGAEAVSLYSPARGNSMRLREDSQFSYYENAAGGYSFLKPIQFTLSELDVNKPGDIIMTFADKETIVMSVQENPSGMALSEWLSSISPAISISAFESFSTLGGLIALTAPQKTTHYIALPASRSVLVVSYTSPGEYSYTTTIRMIVESINVKTQN